MQIVEYSEELQIATPSLVSIGNFDGVHVGHRMLLERLVSKARLLRTCSIVLTFEPHTREVVHGERVPRLTLQREKELLLRSFGIDYCITIPFTKNMASLNKEAFMKNVLVKQLSCKGVVMGEDHSFGRKRDDLENNYPIRCEMNDFYTVKLRLYRENDVAASSTSVREYVSSGEIESACDMLGHPYLLCAVRTRGKRLGRELGYPTLNFLPPPSQKLVPPPGVYAAALECHGVLLEGCLYFGDCPTFGNRDVHFEFFSLDELPPRIDQEREVLLWIQKEIRQEQRFDTPEELVAQMEKDVESIRNYFRKEW
ncbi:bifunctional riboflavin kinase/FMN adenylyltransferase [Chitinivibrio alkaliphilus]|uniref:bifunctional riboflavin kinase/FMN adenylyltransferase n=1 Tax=Chitinivibrio alkaliphilus TaxID=1505232 RepID=UPI0003F8E6F3|nr:riboflavin kinase [Chitinivibrio alkaliphilus]